MDRYKNLIGREAYMTDPDLVKPLDAFTIPVKIDSIVTADNVAACIINGRFVISFERMEQFLKSIQGENVNG